LHGFFQRGGIAEVSGGGFGGKAFEVFQITGGADEQAKLCAPFRESAGDVGAEKSGGACEENFQKQFSVLSSQFSVRVSASGKEAESWRLRTES
jgi:hypothetical protein